MDPLAPITGLIDKAEDLLGHSPHPAIVTLPIGAWAVSNICDSLALLTGDDRYARIRALIRPRAEADAAFVLMVEENEVREELSHFERGRIAVIAANQGAFANTEDAVNKLFASGSKAKRSKVRSFALIFEELGESPKGHKCKGMEGLIREGRDLIAQEADAAVRDAGLIGAAQRIEHYEIAGYGTARTFAERLGMDEAARRRPGVHAMRTELDETDRRLMAIDHHINSQNDELAREIEALRQEDK